MIRLWIAAIAAGAALGALTVIDPVGRMVEAQFEAEV